MVQTTHQTTVIPQLQFIDKVVYESLRCRRGEGTRAPTVAARGEIAARGPDCVKLRKFRSCSSFTVVDISFTAQRQIPTVLSDHRVSPVAFFYGGRCPCLQVVQILRCCLCEDSRDPTVFLVVIPVVAQMQILMVLHHRVSPAAVH